MLKAKSTSPWTEMREGKPASSLFSVHGISILFNSSELNEMHGSDYESYGYKLWLSLTYSYVMYDSRVLQPIASPRELK
jgi:hypothetical protein